MKNNCNVPENESALQVNALRCLSENKLDAMENKLEHVHKAQYFRASRKSKARK